MRGIFYAFKIYLGSIVSFFFSFICYNFFNSNRSGSSRENRAEHNGEIHSATFAIKRAIDLHLVEKLRVNTSSEVLYDAVTGWIPEVKANGWRIDGRKIRNCFSWKKLDKFVCRIKEQKVIEFTLIPANSGDIHQSQADHFAMSGAERWPQSGGRI